jgi:hypothetical protein
MRELSSFLPSYENISIYRNPHNQVRYRIDHTPWMELKTIVGDIHDRVNITIVGPIVLRQVGVLWRDILP